VVIWLNGPFGVGKTTVSQHLVQRIAGSRVVDPERIGFVIKRTFWRGADYQDVGLWRRLTVRQIARRSRDGTVIVPMTVVDRAVFDEITSGAQVFALVASRQALEERIATSGEAEAWRRQQLDRCLAAFAGDTLGRRIATDGRSAAEVTDSILQQL
jgi:broad-specificity NMP kinase